MRRSWIGAGGRGVGLEVDQLVLGRRDDGVNGPRRELLAVDVEVPQDVADQADGVGLVVDGERRLVAEAAGVAPQDADARGVKRRDPHALGDRADEGGHPAAHLVRRLVGEGDGQNLEGRDVPLGDQPGDPVGEHPGLARPGAGDDEQRAALMGDGLRLHRVQTGEQWRRGGGGAHPIQGIRRLRRLGRPLGDRRRSADPVSLPRMGATRAVRHRSTAGPGDARRSEQGAAMSSATHTTAAAAGTIDIGGDLTVNRLGYGAMRITGKGIWGEPRRPGGEPRPCCAGRWSSTSTSSIPPTRYGPDVSETLIAEALYPYPDDLVIATKGGLVRPGPNQWTPDGRPEHLRSVLRGQPPAPPPRADPALPVPPARPEGADRGVDRRLVAMKDEGKIRHIGVSNVTEHDLRRAQHLTPIVSVQNRYNVFDLGSDPLIDLAETESLTFIPWAPVGRRRSTRGRRQDRQEARRHAGPGHAGLAPGPVAGDPAHPGHVIGPPPGGKRGGRLHPAQRRGREDLGESTRR